MIVQIGKTAHTQANQSAWATCVFSYKFLMQAEIADSEDNTKHVEERRRYRPFFSNR